MLKSLISKLLGPSPVTTVLGLVVAGLMVVKTQLEAGNTDWISILIAAFTAILGYKAQDSSKNI